MTDRKADRSNAARTRMIRMIAKDDAMISDSLKDDVADVAQDLQQSQKRMNGTDAVQSNTAQQSNLLELGSDKMIPSESTKTLQNAFHSMRVKPAAPLKLSETDMDKAATDAIERVITKVTEEKISDYIDTLLRARVGHVFDEMGEDKVSNAVAQMAPVHVKEIVEKVTPQLLAGSLKSSIETTLAKQMANMAEAIEGSVSHLVRKELHGSFGTKVTENIKTLIRVELTNLLRGNNT